MNTCSNCHFWAKFGNGESFGLKTGRGECMLASSENGKPRQPLSSAIAIDAESYSAELYTRPSFGCNQHKPEIDAEKIIKAGQRLERLQSLDEE